MRVPKWVRGPAAWRWRKNRGAPHRQTQLALLLVEGAVMSADDSQREATGIASRNAVANARVLRAKNRRTIAVLSPLEQQLVLDCQSVCPVAHPGTSWSLRVPFQAAGRARRLSDADLGGRAMNIGPVECAHVDPRSRMANLLFVAAACVVALIICLGTFRSASAATGRMAMTSRLDATPSAQAHSTAQGAGVLACCIGRRHLQRGRSAVPGFDGEHALE